MNIGLLEIIDEQIRYYNDKEMLKLRDKYEKILNVKLSLDVVKEIYKASISNRQSNVTKIGKYFENVIEEEILYKYNYNYKFQVSLDISTGLFREGNKEPVIDFVIAKDNEDIIGNHINNCAILSLKYTCRERYKQDDKLIALNPKLYILLCCSNDYPNNYKITDSVKLLTLTMKKNEVRNLSVDNIFHLLLPFHYIPTYIDLCCGIGSFHYAMNEIFDYSRCVLASDILPSAKNTYYENYKIYPHDDLKMIDYENINADIVFSGNPCQSFSQIGNRKGLDDERGDLFNFIINNIMRLDKYKIFVFENVHGLITHDKGNTIKKLIQMINDVGYNAKYEVLLCSDYGIPQNRKRVFIFCVQNKYEINLEKIINDVLSESRNSINFINLTNYLNNGLKFKRDIAYTVRCGGLGSPIDSKQNWDGYYVKYDKCNKELVHDENINQKISDTSINDKIVNIDDLQNNKEFVYRLSVDDIKKLQGFPSDFIIKKDAKKLLGNSIPTNLSKIVCKIVMKILKHINGIENGIWFE